MAKKKQKLLSELFTRNTTENLANVLSQPPWQLKLVITDPKRSYYMYSHVQETIPVPFSQNIINTFNLYRIDISNDEVLPFDFVHSLWSICKEQPLFLIFVSFF